MKPVRNSRRRRWENLKNGQTYVHTIALLLSGWVLTFLGGFMRSHKCTFVLLSDVSQLLLSASTSQGLASHRSASAVSID